MLNSHLTSQQKSGFMQLSEYEQEKLINGEYNLIPKVTQTGPAPKKKPISKMGKGYVTEYKAGIKCFIVSPWNGGKTCHFIQTKCEETARYVGKHVNYAKYHDQLEELHTIWRKGRKRQALEEYGDPSLIGSFSQYF